MRRIPITLAALTALALPATADARHGHRHHPAPSRAYGLTETACLANEADQWIEIDGENYCERIGSGPREHLPHTVRVTITIPL